MDDLRERIAEMRQAKQVMDEYQINSSFPIWPRHKYEAITATLAPALADAYDAAQATIAERDAEIVRLKAEREVARARLAAKNVAPHISMTDDVKEHYLMVCAELVALRECINKWVGDRLDALKGATRDA